MKFLTPAKHLPKISRHTNAGFTIIEAVVATTLFAFTISSILAVYVMVVQLDAKSRADRAVISSARYALDYLAKEVRNGTINYGATGYNGSVNYVSGQYYTLDLHVINQLGEREHFYCSLNANGTYTLKVDKDVGGVATITDLHPSNISLVNCKFIVFPSTNPFLPLSSSPPNQQPFVTMILGFMANYGSKVTNTARIDVETTFSVRDYPSRED
jgi:type II secretory pathway pseudopilin PulG